MSEIDDTRTHLDVIAELLLLSLEAAEEAEEEPEPAPRMTAERR